MRGKRRTGPPPPAESAVNWLDLPDELLLSVLDHRLPCLLDLFAASAVCRSWRAVARCPLSSVDRPPLLLSPAVMPRHHQFGENRPSHSAIISPIRPHARSRAMISLRNFGLIFLGSAYGQLIFYDGRYDIIIADIFTGVELRLPFSPKHLDRFSSTALTRPLTHPGSSLLVCFYDCIFRCRLDDGGAGEVFKRGPNAFSIIQMVPFKGEIFGLGKWGRLCAIDVSSSPLSLKELAVQGPSQIFVRLTYGEYLVECGGELMLLQIFPDRPKKIIKNAVYRLSLSGQPEWVRVDSLGDWALFVDQVSRTASSCANPGRWGGRSNCIYFAGPQHGRWNELLLHETIDFFRKPIIGWPQPTWAYPSRVYLSSEPCIQPTL